MKENQTILNLDELLFDEFEKEGSTTLDAKFIEDHKNYFSRVAEGEGEFKKSLMNLVSIKVKSLKVDEINSYFAFLANAKAFLVKTYLSSGTSYNNSITIVADPDLSAYKTKGYNSYDGDIDNTLYDRMANS